jgi:VIT1/CCC1 family predicted Fe2+/Mn2+ transporter
MESRPSLRIEIAEEVSDATDAARRGTHRRADREPVLDPVDRISEVTFGLLMTLSFTGALSVATSGTEDIRTMMFAAIGCNLAWGLVDAVMYLIRSQISRGRGLSIVRAVRSERDPDRADALVVRALPAKLAEVVTPADVANLRARVATLPEPPSRPALDARDFAAALWIFVLVVGATFPVVIPFLLFDETPRAMRWSNAVAVAMLFAAGAALGRHAGMGTVRTGLWMVALGAVMVGAIVLLGG